MNYRLQLLDFHHRFFPHQHTYVLAEKKTPFQDLSVKYQPQIDFLGMFSNNKFMAGKNTHTNLPWNSPFFLYDFYQPQAQKFLFLGGGPCCASTALWQKKNKSSISIEVVEQDKETTKLAQKYFQLPHHPDYQVHIQKVEDYVFQTNQKYDVIFFDIGLTYQRRHDPNYRFCTHKKTIKQLKKLVSNQGIVIFVVIANRKQNQKKFLVELKNKFHEEFLVCDIYVDLPLQNDQAQSHIFILSQQKKLDSQKISQLFARKNGWGKMYRDLEEKFYNTNLT